MFTLTRDLIIPTHQPFAPETGALVTFEGRIRNRNKGKSVIKLEYEAYESMAIKEGARILEEAHARYDIIQAIGVHRIGLMHLGDLGVYIAVASVHRKDAFIACQFIIDTLKHEVPIWKKEYYEDGSFCWIEGC